MKKLYLMILSLLLLVSIFTSCSSGTEIDKTTQPIDITTNATDIVSEEESDYLPNLDLDGRSVNILCRSEFLYEFFVESQTGDIVSDAVYQRNSAISERFNADINYIDITGNWSNRDTFTNAVKADIMSGDGQYDIVAGATNYVMSMVWEGYFHNLFDVSYVNFDSDWWASGFTDNMKIANDLYMATGDIALTSLDNMCVIFFNKGILENHKLDSPYALVTDGNWTFDTMAEMAKAVSMDINSDGVLTAEDDLFGFMTYNNMIRAMPTTFGIPFTEYDVDGYPHITYMSERLVTAFDKVKDFIYGEQAAMDYVSAGDTLTINANMQNIFAESRILFLTQVISSVNILRKMDVDFGIIPYPKLDADQPRYYTTVLENVTSAGIPITTKDSDISGLILEALAFEGYKTITPAFYEIALKDKFTRDNDSEVMLDIIRESAWYDFGYMNSVSLGGINSLFASAMNSGGSLVSSFESNKTAYQAEVDKIINTYKMNLK